MTIPRSKKLEQFDIERLEYIRDVITKWLEAGEMHLGSLITLWESNPLNEEEYQIALTDVSHISLSHFRKNMRDYYNFILAQTNAIQPGNQN